MSYCSSALVIPHLSLADVLPLQSSASSQDEAGGYRGTVCPNAALIRFLMIQEKCLRRLGNNLLLKMSNTHQPAACLTLPPSMKDLPHKGTLQKGTQSHFLPPEYFLLSSGVPPFLQAEICAEVSISAAPPQ